MCVPEGLSASAPGTGAQTSSLSPTSLPTDPARWLRPGGLPPSRKQFLNQAGLGVGRTPPARQAGEGGNPCATTCRPPRGMGPEVTQQASPPYAGLHDSPQAPGTFQDVTFLCSSRAAPSRRGVLEGARPHLEGKTGGPSQHQPPCPHLTPCRERCSHRLLVAGSEPGPVRSPLCLLARAGQHQWVTRSPQTPAWPSA